jgi:hypothetical protein
MYIRAESVGKDKYNSRWEEGVFIGVREESGEIIIGTEKGVIKARAFRRKGSEKERWSQEHVKSIGGVPWEPIPGREGIEIKSSVNLPRDETEIKETEHGVEKEVIRRRLKITKEDVKRFSMTPGCKGCVAVNRGGQAVNHSESCRARITEELEKEDVRGH